MFPLSLSCTGHSVGVGGTTPSSPSNSMPCGRSVCQQLEHAVDILVYLAIIVDDDTNQFGGGFACAVEEGLVLDLTKRSKTSEASRVAAMITVKCNDVTWHYSWTLAWAPCPKRIRTASVLILSSAS